MTQLTLSDMSNMSCLCSSVLYALLDLCQQLQFNLTILLKLFSAPYVLCSHYLFHTCLEISAGFFWRVLLTNSDFIMGRGVSSGGGQSSLGYLFGSGEAPKATTSNVEAPQNPGKVASNEPPQKPTATAPPPAGDVSKQIPAGIPGNNANNYHRADGQNTGNFLTDRPSTKVHAAPGGGSSLGYLFGGGSN